MIYIQVYEISLEGVEKQLAHSDFTYRLSLHKFQPLNLQPGEGGVCGFSAISLYKYNLNLHTKCTSYFLTPS